MTAGRSAPRPGRRRTPTTTRRDLDRLLREYLDALNGRHLDRLVGFYAGDAVLEFPASPPVTGTEHIRRAFASFFDQWDETSVYRSIVVAGSTAAVEGTVTGRHRTLHLRIPGRVPQAARGYRHDFAMFLEFAGGRIRRHRVYFDARELVRQLLGET